MRLSVTITATAVLLAFAVCSLITPVHADEKYKSHPQQPPDNGERYKDHSPAAHPMYKPPDDRPSTPPPPSKEHPEKTPPESRDDQNPYYPPPDDGGWPFLPPPSPSHPCLQPFDAGWNDIPVPDPSCPSA